MFENVKELLFPGIGLIQQVDQANEPELIKYAYLNNDNEVVVMYVDDSIKSLPVKQGSIEPYSYGFVMFSSTDGGDYVIRSLDPEDGIWLSKYKTSIPEQSINSLVVETEETKPMPYLDDEQESLVAFKSPESDAIFGLMYVTKSGAFIRINETWVAVSPTDQSFEGSNVYDVIPETADEFVTLFDNEEPEFAAVEKYLQPVK
jgi:hypothetical protein